MPAQALEGFGVTRVVIEFVQHGQKYRLVYDDASTLPQSIIFAREEAKRARSSLMGRGNVKNAKNLVSEGLAGVRPRRLKTPAEKEIAPLLIVHDPLCDWWSASGYLAGPPR